MRRHLPSCQFFPQPMSTFSGTLSFIARHISSRIIVESDSTALSAVSKTSSSWTCSSILLGGFSALSRRWTLSIAILIRSAAEPWITELIAILSPALRCESTGLFSSGICRRRPRIVST